MRAVRFGCCAVLLVSLSARAQAQEPDPRSAITGKWSPISAMTLAEVGKPLGAAQKQQLERDLRSIASTIKESLTPLHGFDGKIRLQAGYYSWWPGAPGRVTCDGHLYPPAPTGPVLAFALAGFNEYRAKSGGSARIGQTISMSVTFNSIVPVICNATGHLAEDERGFIYPVPDEVKSIQGFKAYFVHNSATPVLVLTPADAKPLWVAVSQEQYLRAHIAKARSTVAEIGGNSPYQSWLREKPQREKDMKDAVAQLRALGMTEQARQLEEQNAKTEQEIGERLKAAEPENAKLFDKPRQQLAVLEAQLNELSPAERAAPAYFAVDGKPLTLLVRATHPEARMLVRVNPAFFDRTLPRTALQIAVVQVEDVSSTMDAWRERASQEILERVDWRRVAQVLR